MIFISSSIHLRGREEAQELSDAAASSHFKFTATLKHSGAWLTSASWND
jgi:hypothetical protein